MKQYEYALAELKDAPFDGTHLLVVSGYLVKMLVAWPLVKKWVVPCDPEIKTGMHLAWEMTRFDINDWAALSHLDKESIWKSWRGLAKANLIYPDGTMPDKVQTYLRRRADEILEISADKNITDQYNNSPNNSLN